MAIQISYAVKVGSDYVNAIYSNDFTVSNSFDAAIQCTSSTEVDNLLAIVDRMTSETCVAIQRNVKYIELQ